MAALHPLLKSLDYINLCARVFQVVSVGGLDASDVVDDGMAVDFKGEPVDKSRTGGWLGAALIAGT
ncbi:hypothetical protein EJB05_37605, partial [Eragrostis curvula]